MGSKHSLQIRREGHAGAYLFVEKKRLLDKSFKDLEEVFMARCPRCKPQSREAGTNNEWTDNNRLPMKWEIISDKALPSLSTLTPRELHRLNSGAEVQFSCSVCQEKCGEIVLSDTAEKLQNDLRNFICHDTSLPLFFDPAQANREIPTEARTCCEDAHKFLAEEHLTPTVLSRIQKSLVAGALQKVLQKKLVAAKQQQEDPCKSCIRIGLLFKPLGCVTTLPVLELWPSGHSSLKHQHCGCAGSMRLLHGNLHVKLYKTLQSEEPMRVPGSNKAGAIEMQAPATTWLNHSNWFVRSVDSPAQTDNVNPRGFALSLHVYLSYTDECAFTVDYGGSGSSSAASSSRAPEKKNHPNDFVWVLPGFPSDDERAQNIPSFNDEVISSTSAAIADKKLVYISALGRDPNNAKAWFNLAVYCGAGRMQGASYNSKECCIRSLELDPADPMPWGHLFHCGGGIVDGARWDARQCYRHAMNLGLNKEGLKKCYIEALEVDPNHAMAWVGLGVCGGGDGILDGGSYNEKMCHIQAVELDPDVSPVAWNNLGVIGGKIVVKGTSYDKERCFVRALELNPEYSMGWNNLGTVGGGSVDGMRCDEMMCYTRALELDPENPNAQANLQDLIARTSQ